MTYYFIGLLSVWQKTKGEGGAVVTNPSPNKQLRQQQLP